MVHRKIQTCSLGPEIDFQQVAMSCSAKTSYMWRQHFTIRLHKLTNDEYILKISMSFRARRHICIFNLSDPRDMWQQQYPLHKSYSLQVLGIYSKKIYWNSTEVHVYAVKMSKVEMIYLLYILLSHQSSLDTQGRTFHVLLMGALYFFCLIQQEHLQSGNKETAILLYSQMHTLDTKFHILSVLHLKKLVSHILFDQHAIPPTLLKKSPQGGATVLFTTRVIQILHVIYLVFYFLPQNNQTLHKHSSDI